jgi:hypothetical protein
LCGEIGQHVACCREAYGVALHERVVGNVLHEHRLTNAVWSEKYGIFAVLDEGEAEEFLDGLSVYIARPGPIESIYRLEGSDPGVPQSTVEAATLSLCLFDIEQLPNPGLSGYFGPPRNQAIKAEAV